MSSRSIYEILAVCSPGLERILSGELALLGIEGEPLPGGVSFKGTLEKVYLSNLWLRTASRILLKIGRFKAFSFKELIEKASRYPWEIYLSTAKAIKIRVTCHRSKLYHSKAVAERILKAISLRLGREIELSREEKAPLLVVRLFKDEVLIRVDSSGGDLFKRGYKVAKGPAPLRENLAAALILLSGWDKKAPFLDPFCGTGTIVIEAAMYAANLAPGLNRSFAFEKWRNFDEELWQNLKEKARNVINPPEGLILGTDFSEKAISASRENAEAAGVNSWVNFQKIEVSRLKPPAPKGFMVTNPPFGKRLKDISPFEKLRNLFKKEFSSWNLTLIYPDKKLPVDFPLKLERIAFFEHGGQKVYVFKKQTSG
ncbi:THUMP domain-containing class I SAM-dependent RNA methyltransferase [Thermodesulfatator autotrophicus]|uniref:THUMP domain-containing protein n=1 Tax=Thermodesulfatator autotrophicus TaxID=1795632 RepID=A0A177E531_9BACT|nr:class I SAM-dependent RNA methyltransferase [Thermodesulfatator autotrophicus]OAG27067.1 hypothetical protein TH606_08985 [Thermodesulfatator autotrophicus]